MPPVPSKLQAKKSNPKVKALGEELDYETLGRWIHERANEIHTRLMGEKSRFAPYENLTKERKQAYAELARLILTDPHPLIREALK